MEAIEELFNPTYRALTGGTSHLMHLGGTRSGKTVAICQALVLYAVEADVERIDIIRHEMATLRKTVRLDLEWVLRETGLYSKDMHNKTENTYNVAGTQIRLLGADGDRLKGATRDVAYINEADQLTEREYNAIQQRTTSTIILDANPVYDPDYHWLGEKIHPVAEIIKSDYTYNCYLTEQQIKNIESYVPTYRDPQGRMVKDWDLELTGEADYRLISGSPQDWLVQGRGDFATNPELIYPTFYEIPFEGPAVAYGLDIGYSNPAALVAISIQQTRDDLYDELHVKQLLYQTELRTPDLCRVAVEVCDPGVPIFSDHDPSVIAALRDRGLTVHKAKKAVQAGINEVRGYKLCVDPAATDVKAELHRYVRKPGSDQPKKAHDHSLDALRYALYTYKHGHWKAEKRDYTGAFAALNKRSPTVGFGR